jgi:hypothetical protein
LKDSEIRFSKFLPKRSSNEFNPKIVYNHSKKNSNELNGGHASYNPQLFQKPSNISNLSGSNVGVNQ